MAFFERNVMKKLLKVLLLIVAIFIIGCLINAYVQA